MARKNEYMVMGFKRVDYRKKDGSEVHGCEVYLEPTEADEGVVGQQFDSVYLSDKYASFAPVLGTVVRKSFNQWGNCEDLVPVTAG